MTKEKCKRRMLLYSTIALGSISAFGYHCVRNYREQLQAVDSVLKDADLKFAQLVEQEDDTFTLIFGGNSFSSGYSMKDEVLPLWKRNEALDLYLTEEKIKYYQVARPQENDTGKFLEDLYRNTPLQDYYQRIRNDYLEEQNGVTSSLSEEQIHKDYQMQETIGIRDLICDQQENEAKILIYCNGTGAYLNEFVKANENGMSPLQVIPKISSTLEEEVRKVDGLFHYLFLNAPDTQIYFVGFPDYLNTGVTDLVINRKYKDMVKQYPNVTYVEAPPTKLIYETSQGKMIDVHPDKREYQLLLANIYQSIAENYQKKKLVTDLYLSLKDENQKVEFEAHEYIKDPIYFDNFLQKKITAYEETYPMQEIRSALEEFQEIYDLKYGTDFYVTPRKELNNQLEDQAERLAPKARQKKALQTKR